MPSPMLYCPHFMQFPLDYVVSSWQREGRMGQTQCHLGRHPQEVAHSLQSQLPAGSGGKTNLTPMEGKWPILPEERETCL